MPPSHPTTILLAHGVGGALNAVRAQLSPSRRIVTETRPGEDTVRIARRARAEVVLIAERGGSPRAEEIATELERRTDAAAVLAVERDRAAAWAESIGGAGVGVLLTPFDAADLELAIVTALQRRGLVGRLRRRARTPASTLGERKIVERAKGVLMARHRLDEDDAHHLLQRRATRARQPLSVVAKGIVEEAHAFVPHAAGLAAGELRFDGQPVRRRDDGRGAVVDRRQRVEA